MMTTFHYYYYWLFYYYSILLVSVQAWKNVDEVMSLIISNNNSYISQRLNCFVKMLLEKGNILAFGDSLTKGFVKEGRHHSFLHPYTMELSRLLNSVSSVTGQQNIDFQDFISEQGKSGETTEFMMYRLRAVLKNQTELSTTNSSNYFTRVKNRNFTFVIILGGTNDLAYKLSPKFIVNNLISMHKLVHEYGGYSIAITVPPLLWPPPAMAIRKDVNNELRKFALSIPDKVALLDLGSFFDDNQENLISSDASSNIVNETDSLFISGKPNEWISSDHVHLSKHGYDQLGQYVFLKLVSNRWVF